MVRFRVKDYVSLGVRQGLRLHEKGGNWLEVPVHHQLEEYLEAYLEAAGIRHDRDGVLFRAADPRRRLTGGRFGLRCRPEEEILREAIKVSSPSRLETLASPASSLAHSIPVSWRGDRVRGIVATSSRAFLGLRGVGPSCGGEGEGTHSW